MLIASLPSFDRETTFVKIAGQPHSPLNPPGGCVFHPRCPRAFDVCPRVVPLQHVLFDRVLPLSPRFLLCSASFRKNGMLSLLKHIHSGRLLSRHGKNSAQHYTNMTLLFVSLLDS